MHALLILIVILCSTFSQQESEVIVPYKDENINNYGYIGILIYIKDILTNNLEKKTIGLKLIKTYENVEKNSKNDIINNNKHFKVVFIKNK